MAENRAPKTGREFSGNMRQRRSRRKTCAFCAEKVEQIDFMDTTRLRKFISERGKILPKRMTGTCAKHQRELTTAIKRARQIALLPYVAD
ncbi:MAG: 30S ribosomal protein S18 [Clostridiales bacterium]|nr:30S ribosomal protein S18 [Clostridiales bacterium]